MVERITIGQAPMKPEVRDIAIGAFISFKREMEQRPTHEQHSAECKQQR
jgi:hypothetical protein